MIKESMAEAKIMLNFWVDVLRLYHWDISLCLLDEAEYVMKCGKDSNALVKWTSAKLSADIAVNRASEDTLEYCIVHELIHVLMVPLEDLMYTCAKQGKKKEEFEELFDAELELQTHQMARALIYAYHQVPKKGKK